MFKNLFLNKQEMFNPNKMYQSGSFSVSYHPVRFCIIKYGCPYCLKAIKAIVLVNRNLPDDKQIRILDNITWERAGLKEYKVMDNLDPKTFNGYPYTWIDGIELEPSEPEQMAIAIAKIVQKDLNAQINFDDIMTV